MSDGPCTIEVVRLAPQAPSGSLACVVVCFNELERIPGFLKFYRDQGVTDFWFIDNASSDGSFEYLLEQSDVSLLRTTAAYSEHRKGLRWSRKVADTFLTGRWVLTVDVDELLVWPGMDDVPLNAFLGYLDDQDYEGVFTLMYDFFPLSNSWGRMDDAPDFIETAPGLLANNFTVSPARHFPNFQVRGGIRLQMISDGGQAPIIHKMPLLRWRPENYYLKSTHYLRRRIRVADLLCGLAHFKFSKTSADKFRHEVRRGQRWADGSQYKDYIGALDAGIGQMAEGAVSLARYSDLETIGALSGSRAYARHVGVDPDRAVWVQDLIAFGDLIRAWPAVTRLNSSQFDDFIEPSFAYDVDSVTLDGSLDGADVDAPRPPHNAADPTTPHNDPAQPVDEAPDEPRPILSRR